MENISLEILFNIQEIKDDIIFNRKKLIRIRVP